MKLVYPKFTKGRILKLDMLENLRDYSRDTLDILTSNLSDGIIEGIEPIVNEDTITFTKGIVKHKGNIYIINEKVSISYGATEVEALIKLVFINNEEEPDYKVQNVKIILDKNTNVLENEIELGRFKLKDGAYLRTDYKDLDDYTTEFNTINIINVKYANIDTYTLSPSFMRKYGNEILVTKTKEIWDVNFGIACINSSKMSRKVILNYINVRLNEDNTLLSNYELHHKLTIILNKVREENYFVNNKKRERRTILVD